jgi:anthranilate phosphoribosyltransferase
VWELKGGDVSSYTLTPEDMGLGRSDRAQLRVDGAEGSAAMLRGVLGGSPGPARDIVLANAAAALLAADRVSTLEEGVSMAAESIDSGAAREKLEALVALSQRLE